MVCSEQLGISFVLLQPTFTIVNITECHSLQTRGREGGVAGVINGASDL